jgi:nitrate/TMAO reductase-like tetraheme cytochrome c subunit
LLERRRRLRHPDRPPAALPRIDFNEPRQQIAALMALIAAVVIVVLLSLTGYRAYHFTDSIRFCGLLCHKVMKPEYVAYQHSPHARVTCVQCHVGPGAGWYVRSKMSGLYQVYSATANKYPRPIPTPVKNLRPAQQTCEQCHWPAKFFGAQQKNFAHTLADEANSPWQIQMLIKVGGGDPKTGATAGIHWHMNIKNEISYISDESREEIPWVRVVGPDGQTTEYMSQEKPLTPQQLASQPIRRMDCVDCHNRPSHIFRPPDTALDAAFEAGLLDRSLPYLKREAVRVMIQEYATESEALTAIARELPAFYSKEYPDTAKEKAEAIAQAVSSVQQVYSHNQFPEMRADWRAHPNHVGHLTSVGCFRCHDGQHKSADGRVITKDCNACHAILAQGSPEDLKDARLSEQPFRHPVDVGVDVTEFRCSECHTGTSGL